MVGNWDITLYFRELKHWKNKQDTRTLKNKKQLLRHLKRKIQNVIIFVGVHNYFPFNPSDGAASIYIRYSKRLIRLITILAKYTLSAYTEFYGTGLFRNTIIYTVVTQIFG